MKLDLGYTVGLTLELNHTLASLVAVKTRGLAWAACYTLYTGIRTYRRFIEVGDVQ